MFVYNITFNVEPPIESEWLKWMKNEYILDFDNLDYQELVISDINEDDTLDVLDVVSLVALILN